jgi:hypothetical protein
VRTAGADGAGELAEAFRAVEAFESVGVGRFQVFLLDDTTYAESPEWLDGPGLRGRLPYYLERNAAGRESLIVQPLGAGLIQVDDCDEAVRAWLEPWAFLTEATSPGNYQVWLCVTPPRACDAVRERLLRKLEPTGANGGAFGATRWPGSRNCKLKHRRPNEPFPTVRLARVASGRRVTRRALKRVKLLSPPAGGRRLLKNVVCTPLHALGVTWAFAWLNRKKVVVLRYHGVSQRALQGYDHLHRDRFDTQLDYLQRHYRVVALRDCLAARREGRPLPPRTVVLAFDLGWRNFLTVAAPQLARRCLPATVFLNVERVRTDATVASDQRWTRQDDIRLLSWSEAKALECAQAVELGLYGDRPHVRTTSLASLPDDETERELRALVTLMADQLSESPAARHARKAGGVEADEWADPVPIAFPKGGHSATLVEQARRLGFSCAVTWDSPWRTGDGDGFNLPSVAAGETSDNIAVFAARLSGLFDCLRRVEEALCLRNPWSAVENLSGWARAMWSAPTRRETRGGGAAGPPGGP